jgi:hypothetical protein
MRCHEFERIWNERLDAATTARDLSRSQSRSSPLIDPRLEQHAATCSACRQLAARFATLERAINRQYPVPNPSPQLTNRILNAAHEFYPVPPRVEPIRFLLEGAHKFRVRLPLMSRLAAAIYLLLISSIGIVIYKNHVLDPQRVAEANRSRLRSIDNANRSIPSPETAPTLNSALANAGEATWRLTRAASEPAASIGRELLEAAIPQVSAATFVPSVLPETASASSALEQIGSRLSEGAAPLSSATRRAFRFLSLPSTEKNPARRVITPAAKRA